MASPAIRLTQYSHGAGCGCKISPKVLDKFCILSNKVFDPRLLVGNETRDDAAVYDIGNGVGIISTTDFLCRSLMILLILGVLPPQTRSAMYMLWAVNP